MIAPTIGLASNFGHVCKTDANGMKPCERKIYGANPECPAVNFPSMPPSFEDGALAAMLVDDRVRWDRRVEAYVLSKRGISHDVLAKKFGMNQRGISNWVRKVKAEIARRYKLIQIDVMLEKYCLPETIAEKLWCSPMMVVERYWEREQHKPKYVHTDPPHPEFGIDANGNWPHHLAELLGKYGLTGEFMANVGLIDGYREDRMNEVRSLFGKPVTVGPDLDDLEVFAIVAATKLAAIKDGEKQSFYKQNLALLVRSIKQMEGYSEKMVGAIVKYMQFRARKTTTVQDVVPVQGDGPFLFTEDDAFAAMLAGDRVKWETQVEAYKANTRVGTAQDVLGTRYGFTQKAVSNWVRAVKGEIARIRGEAYEIHLERTQRASGKWRDVTRVSGESNTDIVRTCFDGTVEIVSVKCHDSVRPETSLITDENDPKCEIAPELDETRARLARGERVRLVLHFYNHSSKFVEERVLDPARLRPSECFIENRTG